MSNIQHFLSALRNTAWSTSGARFNAARRLKRRDWFATLSIALFSAIGIGLAVVQKTYAFKADTPGDRYLTALSVCIGLFVGVISLIEWGSANSARADALHRNAEELNTFHRKIEQVLAAIADGHTPSLAEVTSIREEYEALKGRCPYNHAPVDYRSFLAQHRLSPEHEGKDGNPKMGWVEARWHEIQGIFSAFGYYLLFWLVICALILLTPWSVS